LHALRRGAAGEAAIPGETIICTHCGTPFRVPDARQTGGGVHIGSGAQITIMKDDVVGGDKVVAGKSPDNSEEIRAAILERLKQAQSVEAPGETAGPATPTAPSITTPAPPPPPENFFKRWWRQLFK
jgi:hypothetical protein